MSEVGEVAETVLEPLVCCGDCGQILAKVDRWPSHPLALNRRVLVVAAHDCPSTVPK